MVKWLGRFIQVIDPPGLNLPSSPSLLAKIGQHQAIRQAGWLFQLSSRILYKIAN